MLYFFGGIMFGKRKIKLAKIAKKARKTIRQAAPYDTGDLRRSITVKRVSDNEQQITVGDATAYYAVYTNETWISPRWHGKKNPTEHWIDSVVKDIAEQIAKDTGGKLLDRRGKKRKW